VFVAQVRDPRAVGAIDPKPRPLEHDRWHRRDYYTVRPLRGAEPMARGRARPMLRNGSVLPLAPFVRSST
jgi:hypothetical protein